MKTLIIIYYIHIYFFEMDTIPVKNLSKRISFIVYYIKMKSDTGPRNDYEKKELNNP